MSNDPVTSPHRRRLLAASMGAAAASILPLRAAPPLVAGQHVAAPNAWLEVDPAVFDHNLALIRSRLAGNPDICAVMKADAYGVGIEHVMPNVIRAGIPYVGIASNEEARMARACGFRGRLMRVRAGTPDEVAEALPHDVEELVGDIDAARRAARLAPHGAPLRVHLALNAGGMSRNGLEMGNAGGRREAREIVALEGLRIVGLMTHFPLEERPDTLRMLEAFHAQAAWLFAHTRLRRRDVLLHAANSYAVQHVPESHLDMVRPGGALYGYGGTDKPPFAHVIAFKTRVASVNDYPAGSTVSYDRTHALRRDSLLANLPVGYADGYRRAFSNKAHVLVHGRRAPVVGRVSMNSTMVDVTDIPGVRPGDEVVLFGRQGEEAITQKEVEDITGVILADQYTVWGALNPKIPKR